MPAFQTAFEPAAKPDQFVETKPNNTTYRVNSVEQIPDVSPVDFGAITSGSRATESGNEEISVDELELRGNQIGQYRIYPISWVEILVRQTGKQDVRFDTKNVVPRVSVHTPEPHREIFVEEEGDPVFLVENNMPYDMDASLVEFYGWKYNVEQVDPPDNVQPVAIPTQDLGRSTQGAGSTSGSTQGRAGADRRGR